MALTCEQHELSQKASQSSLSLNRLTQRLVVLERYFIAVSRKGKLTIAEPQAEKVEVEKDETKEKELATKTPEGRFALSSYLCVCVCMCCVCMCCVCMCLGFST